MLFAVCGGGESKDNLTFDTGTSMAAYITELRCDLASTEKYYFETNVTGKKIDLCNSGIVIKSYPFMRIEIGIPRFIGFRKNSPGKWMLKKYDNLYLKPAKVINRINIVPGDQKTCPSPDIPGFIPPTMTEIIPVPSIYSMNAEDEIEIEVILKGEIPGSDGKSSLKTRLSDYISFCLGTRKIPAVKLRIEMDSVTGAAMFRSFPESPSLLILP